MKDTQIDVISMFTHEGNKKVLEIVNIANNKFKTSSIRAYKYAIALLEELANDPRYSEATDTEVKEEVSMLTKYGNRPGLDNKDIK